MISFKNRIKHEGLTIVINALVLQSNQTNKQTYLISTLPKNQAAPIEMAISDCLE